MRTYSCWEPIERSLDPHTGAAPTLGEIFGRYFEAAVIGVGSANSRLHSFSKNSVSMNGS